MRAVISYTERFGLPIGSVHMIEENGMRPGGTLECDGRTVWINDYARLYKEIGHKYCSLPEADDEEDTYFTLPDFRCYRESKKTWIFDGEHTEDDNYLDRIGVVC